MTNLLILLLFLFVIAFLYILFKNVQMAKLHSEKMDKLQHIIFSLNHQQEALNNKLLISNLHNVDYKKDVKALGEEIVALQKVFIEIISNQKNS